MTAALRRAPVSVVLPMDYSSIVWTTLLGWAIWGNWPMATTWIGAALIVGSGLYIAWREHVRAPPPPSARSDARRVGTEGGSTERSRGAPVRIKNNKKNRKNTNKD